MLGLEVTGSGAIPRLTADLGRPQAACRVSGADAGPFGAGEFDVLIDTVGGPGLAARLDSIRAGGVAVIVGYTAATVVSLDLPARCAHDVSCGSST